jgi:hypothetical protein
MIQNPRVTCGTLLIEPDRVDPDCIALT